MGQGLHSKFSPQNNHLGCFAIAKILLKIPRLCLGKINYTSTEAIKPNATEKAMAKTPGIKKAWLNTYLPSLVEPVSSI